jgi:hypothetical protein
MEARENVQEETIVDFFKKIEGIGGVLKAVAGDKLQAVVEFRPSGRRVLLDLTQEPVKVTVGEQGIDGTTGMAGTVEDLHEAFVGKLNVIEGIGQRKLLTKGAMCHMVSFFPVMGLTPVLYGDHLYAANGRKPGAIRRSLAAFIGFFFGIFAWLGGLLLRGLKRKELLVALGAMSRGSGRFSPHAVLAARPPMPGKSDHKLAAPRPGFIKRIWIGIMSFNMYLSGWFVSLFRYKLGLPIDLFKVLAKLARGLGY